jgi:hypothetical protein
MIQRFWSGNAVGGGALGVALRISGVAMAGTAALRRRCAPKSSLIAAPTMPPPRAHRPHHRTERTATSPRQRPARLATPAAAPTQSITHYAAANPPRRQPPQRTSGPRRHPASHTRRRGTVSPPPHPTRACDGCRYAWPTQTSESQGVGGVAERGLRSEATPQRSNTTNSQRSTDSAAQSRKSKHRLTPQCSKPASEPLQCLGTLDD